MCSNVLVKLNLYFLIEMSSLLIGLQFVVDDETLEVEIKITVLSVHIVFNLELELKNL